MAKVWPTEFTEISPAFYGAFTCTSNANTVLNDQQGMFTNTHFFIGMHFIRILRLKFGSRFLAISRNIPLGIYLTARKERTHPEMLFKAVFEGGRVGKFEKQQAEVKNI